MDKHIFIEHATENNLKDITISIPHYKLIVVTGVSGSGKSSLVNDVICREGQRLFIDNFAGGSFHAAKKMRRPQVKNIEGLLPVISVNRSSAIHNTRSTVGTLTEIYDYLRLLFARLGTTSQTDIKPARSLFSFNSPSGYCSVCKGLGVEDHIAPELLIGDSSKSLREGALVLTTPNGYVIYSQVTMDVLDTVCKAEGFSVDVPWKDLTNEQKHIIWYGSKKIKILFGKHPLESRLRWTGITAKPREEDYYKGILTVMEEILKRERNPNIMRFVRSYTCSACEGHRLNKKALSYKLWGNAINVYASMSIHNLFQWFTGLKLSGHEQTIAAPVLDAIIKRLAMLKNLGLDYLTLDRVSNTLSGGEAQRIRLANQAATGLRNVLYLLDEPSAGLHPSDHNKMLGILRSLVNNGNTVIVVEHDENTIRSADWLIDIGPGPGNNGGNILFNGPAYNFLNNNIADSITSRYLNFKKEFPETIDKKDTDSFFEIANANKNNLRNITVHFKHNAFNVITGVSGSGKSSLAGFLLETTLPEKLGGTDVFRKAIHINQSPIGRTPSSNPATYTGLSDHIRDLMAALPESKAKGFKKGQFSFVVKGGRCEACNGAGIQQIGMHFLGNVDAICDECNGKRFTDETLSIRYKDKNIFEILNISVEEAHIFFSGNKKITAITQVLIALGLGYIKLGQPSTSLSGGEAQRVKLAAELSKNASGKILYILDEPTTGLHMADVEVLLKALRNLVEKGHTIISIEHHPDFITQADWVVDLGPGSGDFGGTLVTEGNPMEIIKCQESLTGKELIKTVTQKEIAFKENIIKEDCNNTEPMMLSGVTTNNLKNSDVLIPVNAITAVTGVSGSGKSSLVFDTFYAESQRRFMDGLSSYFRQFMGKTGNALVEMCKGITPSIGIEKKNIFKNPRSTVSTYSGIYDLYRLLYSRLGRNNKDLSQKQSASFSFNNDEGACDSCKGLGVLTLCDEVKLISTPSLPLTAGALDETKTGRFYGDPYGQYVNTLIAVGKSKGIDYSLPFCLLDDKARSIALFGCGNEIFNVEWKYKRGNREGVHHMNTEWKGFCGLVNDEYTRKHADHRGSAMLPLMKIVKCPVCHGFRLKPEMLSYTVNGFNIGELSLLTADESYDWFDLQFEESFCNEQYGAIAKILCEEIKVKLKALIDAGLGYIALGRSVQSLSGGEFQRLKLAVLTGSPITGLTYVLDEPSFGLHHKDIKKMASLIEGLYNKGNSVLMTELSPYILEHSHHIIELGPEAGIKGGNIIYTGTPGAVIEKIKSATFLSDKPKRTFKKNISIKSACANNLKNININIPVGGITAITGVSGSGKTSLIYDVIFKSYLEGKPESCREINIFEVYNNIQYIEQDVPAGTMQSVPATWLGLSEHLKKIFASSPEAKEKGFGASHFSFNSRDGQCPDCKGNGSISISLDFWNDAKVTCETCKGKRYNTDILNIKIDGLSVADVLAFSFSEASYFFKKHLSLPAWKQVDKIFIMAEKTGINYLTLGQTLDTLSTGELQRLKLVYSLGSVKEKNVLYLLDEPTGGLHPADTHKLLNLFDELVNNGASILCVTHDAMVSSYADYLVELGPGGGNSGGSVVYEGYLGGA